jgi:hypothetical protein
MFSLLRILHIVFQSGRINFILPTVYEGSFVPAYSPTFFVGGIFDDNYSNRREVES